MGVRRWHSVGFVFRLGRKRTLGYDCRVFFHIPLHYRGNATVVVPECFASSCVQIVAVRAAALRITHVTLAALCRPLAPSMRLEQRLSGRRPPFVTQNLSGFAQHQQAGDQLTYAIEMRRSRRRLQSLRLSSTNAPSHREPGTTYQHVDFPIMKYFRTSGGGFEPNMPNYCSPSFCKLCFVYFLGNSLVAMHTDTTKHPFLLPTLCDTGVAPVTPSGRWA